MTLRMMNSERPAFSASYPVSLALSNGSVPVLYLSYTGTQTLQLTMTNVSGFPLLLPAQDDPPDEAGHHFRFTFQPGVLDNSQLGALTLAEAGWGLRAEADSSGGTILYVSSIAGQDFGPQSVIVLTLQNVTVATNATLSLTQVGMSYQLTNVQLEAQLRGKRTAFLQTVPESSGSAIVPPLWFGFNGSNTILNDGATPNALALLIANAADTGALTLTPSTSVNPTTFVLRFATEGSGENRPWSLGNVSQVQEITVTEPDSSWSVAANETTDVPEWIITTTNSTLPAGSSASFALSGIVSGMADGDATVFLDYYDLPGFADGQVTCFIRKGPAVLRGQKLAIGAVPGDAASALSVSGNVRASSFTLDNGERLAPLPIGTILMWYGDPVSIPTGWTLCNGKNGTPDLMGRMPMGAGDKYPLGSRGGREEITLTEENLPPHAHGYSKFFEGSNDWKSGGHDSPGNGTGGDLNDTTDYVGEAVPFNIVPPFTSVYFIMKFSNTGAD
ncbi:hypothetical protein ACQR1I_36605 [Bradyrhizobium sp. HKCCYLS2038]|uniref:hypothetical protein n=1 Tax=unclassified Bradyrhizobium TaxID=2631580 RepID=UPI003EBDA455